MLAWFKNVAKFCKFCQLLTMWREARSELSERRRNDDFTGVKRYSIPVGIRVKVQVANAKQFGQQLVITIQTWWTLLFFGIRITARIPNQTKKISSSVCFGTVV